jgi:hypothetical protein
MLPARPMMVRAGDDASMRQVDTIIANFPGPVTLTPSRRKSVIALAACVAVTAVCVYLIATGRLFGWEDTVMAWAAAAFFGACAARALILLLVPTAAGLTLDDDGFEITSIIRRVHVPWRHVSGFRAAASGPGKDPRVSYEVRDTAAPPQSRVAPKITRTLPDNYGLPADDLAWLMDEWRQQALAQRVIRFRH